MMPRMAVGGRSGLAAVSPSVWAPAWMWARVGWAVTVPPSCAPVSWLAGVAGSPASGWGGSSRGSARTVMTAQDVLRRKRTLDGDYVITDTEPLSAGIRRITHHGRVHALVVVSAANGVVQGLVTARDLLRALDKNGGDVTQRVDAAMTPSSRVVHIAPGDTITQASLIMSELKIAHLPVIHNGEVRGVVSLQDIADVALEHTRGGKESMVRQVLPRRGIHSPTRIATAASAGMPHGEEVPLFMHCGATALPRPKREETPIEDAHFVSHLWWPATALPGRGGVAAGAPAAMQGVTITYIGVADGVGSWHAYDVDPRLYATRLMSAAQEYCWKQATAGAAPPTTMEVLQAAWETVQGEKVIGSATAMIISLDPLQHQLNVTSVGDCGMILLRDTDINRVGSLLRGGTAAGIRPGWRVSARATQQLRGFNQPYQLGWAPDNEDKFEKPWNGETLVLPVHEEDIVIAGSDGLYDNMDETDILEVLEAWDKPDLERRWQARAGKMQAAGMMGGAVPPAGFQTDRPHVMDGTSISMQELSRRLAWKARDFSLDRMRDGPFARLAKENDIMWSAGGRPDDTTVVAARISKYEKMTVLR